MDEAADLRKFEEFQGRAFHTALVLWMAALAISLILSQGYSPIVGGVVLGGAASVAAFRYRVWTLRRLARQPTGQQAHRQPILGAVRYLILAAGLGSAAWLGVATDDMGYLFAAAGMIFLGNAAIIFQAVRESRRNTGT